MRARALAPYCIGLALPFLAGGAARAADCASLKDHASPDAEITTATLHPAEGGELDRPGGAQFGRYLEGSRGLQRGGL